MKSAVIVFPASNCDRDARVALKATTGKDPHMIWHQDSELPDVDPKRIGVTGESGGGTQTMLIGALDSRPAVLFPAVMVSTAMQGGCTCENCSYLRVGTGNVEFAAMAAPRPPPPVLRSEP